MSRRKTELFNLSFLDLLSGALGAVIFLFIITPKGGQPAAKTQQVVVALDTLHRQVFGALPDSLLTKKIGDTLLVLVGSFDQMPTIEDCPECPPPTTCPPRRPCPECPACPEVKSKISPPVANLNPSGAERKSAHPSALSPPKATQVGQKEKLGDSAYQGDPPAVPCNVSFEINWGDMGDNIDLIVCKDGNCVSGKKKKHKSIGQWSSGITPTNIFGTDFRTSQEAVRQFRQLIPGKYVLKARYKESENNKPTVNISGLIYTQDLKGKQQGKRFERQLSLDPKKEFILGTVDLKANGDFHFSPK